MEEYSGYVGLDVHKETISPAVAYPGRSKPESLGVIANTKKSVQNLVHRLSRDGEVLGFCYEAGPRNVPKLSRKAKAIIIKDLLHIRDLLHLNQGEKDVLGRHFVAVS